MRGVLKVVFRIIALPFMMALIIIGMIKHLIIRSGLFLWYGGEAITYSSIMSSKTIQDVYEKMFVEPKERQKREVFVKAPKFN